MTLFAALGLTFTLLFIRLVGMSQNILVLVDNVITRAGAKLYLKAEMPPSQAAII